MIECRYCRAFFRTQPEKIGARCPECKMPLFERQERSKREVETGLCHWHLDVPAVAECFNCQKRLCAVCRTRWHEKVMCPDCVRASVAADEVHPRDVKLETNRAARSLAFAVLGWSMFIAGIIVLLSSTRGPLIGWCLALALTGLMPAVFALGHATVLVLNRGPLFRVATSAMFLSSAQIGVTLGLVLLNFVRN